MARDSKEPKDPVVVSDTPAPTTGDFERATHRVNSDITKKDIKRRRLADEYANETRVTVMIAPMYAAYFGRHMHVSLNGISIAVPCNGRPYMIPESYAAEVQARLRRVNDQQAKQKAFADVGNNRESSPGELPLY